jgi:5'-nucleotidase
VAGVAILFTADMHNRLGPEVAERLRALKLEHQALLLDGGDAISATNVTVRAGREPILPLMNRAGYDAMVMGNREYYFTGSGLRRKTAGADFPVLAANVDVGPRPGPFRAGATFERGGLRLGVIGLARQMIRPGAGVERVIGPHFTDWLEAARRLCAELRPQVDLLIALSHLGREGNDRLTQELAEIDLLLAGHEHPPAMSVDPAGLAQAVYAKAYVSEVCLIETDDTARPFHFRVKAVSLE